MRYIKQYRISLRPSQPLRSTATSVTRNTFLAPAVRRRGPSSRLLTIIIDIDLFWRNPNHAAVLPSGHRATECLVQSSGVSRSQSQRLIDQASVFEQLVDGLFVISHWRTLLPPAAMQRNRRPWSAFV